jgi:FdhD protein
MSQSSHRPVHALDRSTERSAEAAEDDADAVSADHLETTSVIRHDRDGRPQEDTVVVEAPLEIRLRYEWRGVEQTRDVAVTMRTPGSDKELALGFLYNEGIITSMNDVSDVSGCENRPGALRVSLKHGVTPGEALDDRKFYATSSCGVCGKGSSDQIWRSLPDEFPFVRSRAKIDERVLLSLPGAAGKHQALFERTGGNHATALFSHDGNLLALREDVGRHNATDKIVGSWLLREFARPELPTLFLSGRISFELVQKALHLGVEVIAAVGAPSSLAIEIADHFDITLIGFLRGNSYNVYTGSKRITM